MAQIVVKDLKENSELDRKAMQAIVGGNAGLRPGVPAWRAVHFQNPLSFISVKLLPGVMDSGFNR